MESFVETDVLVVGSGPAGGAAALLLSTYGVPNIVVTNYGRLATRCSARAWPARSSGGCTPGTPTRLRRNMDARKLAGPEAEKQRRELRDTIEFKNYEFKNYEFNTHGVELNQRYASSAVLPDGTPMPANPRDGELYAFATTWPGDKLPHAWVGRDRTRVSTLDLCGQGRFTVLTGIGGEAWRAAADALGIAAVTIGPGADHEDLYGDWARLREIGDPGCVLVRPDNYVCFRSAGLPEDPAGTLRDALDRVLSRPAASY